MNDLNQQIAGRRVFVSGASGFIGGHLVRALIEAGADVTAWSRSRRGVTALKGSPANVIVGNLNDAASLQRVLRGQDVVFHLAYDGRATAAANLKAFDSLFSVATQAQVGRFVHTSSIVVYDDWPDADIDENSSMNRPGGGSYRQAKIEMERRLIRGKLPVAIIQPTIVYGPGSALWTDQFAEQLAAGEIVLPEPEGRCNGVFVDDLVQALLRAAVIPNLERERFIVSGPTTFSWSALLEGYARFLGTGSVAYEPLEQLQGRLAPQYDEPVESDTLSPVIRAYAVGHKILGRDRFERLVRSVKRFVARDGRAYPDHHLLGLFCSSGVCSISQARRRLGYEPTYDLAEGLAAMDSYLRRFVSGD